MRPFLFSLIVPAVCFAQAPKIVVDQAHFNFGKLFGETKAVHRFRVTNQGSAQLNISRLNPSCGCTSTVMGQWTLNPGQSTEVEATFNPAGFRGLVHKSIQVISNDPSTPTLTLTFEAEVLREVNPSMDSVFYQDIARSAGTQRQSVTFSSGNGHPVRILDASFADAPFLKAAVHPKGLDAVVDITLNPREVPPSRAIGTTTLNVRTDNPKAGNLAISVIWELRASIVAQPIRVAWVEAAGKEQRAKLVFRHVDKKPFRIKGAKSTLSLLRIEGLDKAGSLAEEHELTVVLGAQAKAGMYNEKILVQTDSPDQPEVEVRVAASLR